MVVFVDFDKVNVLESRNEARVYRVACGFRILVLLFVHSKFLGLDLTVLSVISFLEPCRYRETVPLGRWPARPSGYPACAVRFSRNAHQAHCPWKQAPVRIIAPPLPASIMYNRPPF